jgi:hypothetical protein
MAGVLATLEYERKRLITTDMLTAILQKEKVATPTRVVAARLREKGWLIATACRGVWEFSPAALAGTYSQGDPMTPLRSFLLLNPGEKCALTFQAAAWASGFADRIPMRPEVASATVQTARRLPNCLNSSVFQPALAPVLLKYVPVFAPESVFVHMVAKPTNVRSWSSAVEWLPTLMMELSEEKLLIELQSRHATDKARAGYLLQGTRPDLSDRIFERFPPQYKTWFGPRGPLHRHDNRWLIADTLLPFDPKKLEENREY